MRIGFGIFLIAVGAILTFASRWHISGLNVQLTGVILMLVGLAWAAISAALYRSQRHGAVVTRTRRLDDGIRRPGEIVYEESQSIDRPAEGSYLGRRPGIYDEVTHPGKAVTYPPPQVLEDPPSRYNDREL